jgi:NADPH:quinone reductase-like Zn-dependent oxidoreductase
MRAAMIKAFGEPSEALELVDVPEPKGPAAGEVLVGVEYAPVNMNDLYLIQGAFPVRPSLPSLVGNEGVGRVLAVGSGVEHIKVGDRVLIPLYAFSWRERLVLPAAGLFSLPDADPQQLAMLGINPPTASLLLDEAPDLKPGDWIVQNAANSGVGRSLIAIAKARGMKTINLVRRPELIPELEAIGGDLVVVDEDGALDRIRAAIGNGRVPLAIDGVSGDSSALIAGALSAHGIFVIYAFMGGGPVTINPFDLIGKRVIAKGFFMNHPDIEPKIPEARRESIPLVASGAIRVPIAATYPLSALREAVLHAQHGGKVLLDLRATTRA